MHVAPDLIDEVLKQFQSGDVALGQTGKGAVEEEPKGPPGVEAPILQLVMERLWEVERAQGSDWLRLDTLTELGGAERIVRTHLDAALAKLSDDDQETAARVFGRLVTPSGTKIAHVAGDLAESEELPPERVTAILEPLAAARILRPVAPAPGRSEIRYEIFHDVLAPAVLDWRARRLERRRHAEEQSRLREQVAQEAKERAAAEDEAHRRRKRARILAAVATVAAVAALAAIAIAIVAIKKQREADDAKRRSEVSNLVRDATLALRSNPALALHSAASAVTRERSRLGHASEQTVAALRQAVRASSLALQLEPGAGAVRQAIFTTEGDRIVTVAEGRLDLWSPADGRHVAGTDLKTGGRVLDVAAAGGTVVAGMSDGQVLSWRPGSSPRARARVAGAATRVLVRADGDVLVESRHDRRRDLVLLSAGRRARVLARNLVALDTRGDRFLIKTVRGLAVVTVAGPRRRTALAWPGNRSLRVRTAAFSADGRTVVAVAAPHTSAERQEFDPTGLPTPAPSYVSAWDARTGETKGSVMRRETLTAVAVDANGDTAAVAAADGSGFRWRPSTDRAASQRSVRPLTGHTSTVGSIAFTPDRRWIVTGSGDGTARVWSAASGISAATLLGHEDWVSSAALSPDGARIVTASDDGTARIWRFPLELPEAAFHMRGYTGAELSRDGRRVLLGTHDDSARLVDAGTGRTIRTIDRGNALATAFGPDGLALTADPEHLAAWDPQSGLRVGKAISVTVERPPDVSADGTSVVASTGRGLREWHPREGTLGPVLAHSKDVFGPAVSPDGRYVTATRSNGSRVWVWDLESGVEVGAVRGHDLGFFAPAIAPGGKLLAIAKGPRTVLYTPHDGKRQFAVRSHGPVYMIEFSADGKLLLTAGSENTARVWDIRTHRKLAVLRGHTGVLEDVAFSPDSRLVITGSDDGTARVWDARTGELLDAVRQDAARPASSVSFTSDSHRFLAASERSAAIYTCTACGTTDDLLALAAERRVQTRRP